jgi:hypothetical protein
LTVSEHQFNRERILGALKALGEQLLRDGVRGQIFIVGGAAMALAYSTRRVTKDIDAVFEPKSAVHSAAAKVAEDLGLPEDWLNDAVKGFMPGADEHPRQIPDIDGIEVTTASPRYRVGPGDSHIEQRGSSSASHSCSQQSCDSLGRSQTLVADVTRIS